MQNSSTISSALCAIALLSPPALAQASGPVREGALVAEIVAAKSAIAPGETIDLALRIAHDEKWHTYWKCPGIVGVPTDIDWKLPAGFVASDILWPQPELVMMGPYRAYGYEGEVFLIVPFTAPVDAKPGDTAKLKARASWMCCAKTCHPAFVDLTFEIPVTAEGGKPTKWEKHIAASRATFAKPNTQWEADAQKAGEEITLTLKPKVGQEPKLPKKPYFFCDDGLIHSDTDQIVKRAPDGSLSIKLKTSEFGPENPTHLNGILFTETGHPDDSGATAISMKVPLTTR